MCFESFLAHGLHRARYAHLSSDHLREAAERIHVTNTLHAQSQTS